MSDNRSREVTSNQHGIHPQLDGVVRKHLCKPWRKPISYFSVSAFEEVLRWLEQSELPLILDSGCGTGESTMMLARSFPDYSVLGFDRSADRISRYAGRVVCPANCLVLRADARDLWRQLTDANLVVHRHYLLYPNPYPKASRLNLRWHGSPAFKAIIDVGGVVEVRSNWRLYVEEFQVALRIAGINSEISTFVPADAFSPFERKYQASGHLLWRLEAVIG